MVGERRGRGAGAGGARREAGPGLANRPESAVQSGGRGRARGLSGGQGHGDELMDGMRTLKHGEAT